MSKKVTAKTANKGVLPDFEAALKELEQIAEAMEHGELPLDAALASFERGIKLTRSCQKALAEAEQQVEKLVAEDGGLHLETHKGENEDAAQ